MEMFRLSSLWETLSTPHPNVLSSGQHFLLRTLLHYCHYSPNVVQYNHRAKSYFLYGLHNADIFLFFFLGTSDYILLTIMVFDRYVAICKTLRYSVIMSGWFTFQLAAGSWTGAFSSVLFSTIPFYLIPFCDPNVINHFSCDILPVLRLPYKDTTMLKWLNYISTAPIVLCSLFLTSYIYISLPPFYAFHLHLVNKKHSQPVLLTLFWPSFFYRHSIFMYLLPEKIHSSGFYKGMALLHTVVTPLLNAFIYTLRNEKVKEVFKNALKQMDILAPKVE